MNFKCRGSLRQAAGERNLMPACGPVLAQDKGGTGLWPHDRSKDDVECVAFECNRLISEEAVP